MAFKAKTDLEEVGRKLGAIREDTERKVTTEVKVKIDEYGQAACELVERLKQKVYWTYHRKTHEPDDSTASHNATTRMSTKD
ncbi:hypothetical protein SAPIO_CDS1675 [Scedosporium apiospermum]|uniref:Uncharacterized protein n=1 Tax=Pseudallescheria apiosperma TaxID=563466 RepID=A0A084GET7_PSEDA|nr:uncharacterized protein SAPIO_CDS1675 [Scedosporium apiospermum]KEZ45849.1 hypothetical protein SAPIO_CDS1675 [Scedosporium apiospermum]